MSRRRGGRLLQAASRLSMLIGVVLFAAGLAIRTGVFAPAAAGVGPSPAPNALPAIAQASSTQALGSSSAVGPSPSAATFDGPAATPSSLGEILFADDFATEAAWPVGPVAGATARYENGAYILDAQPIDLPGYVFPAAGDGPLPETLTVSATFEIGGPTAQAGLVVADVSGAMVGALVSADGRVMVIRDSMEAFDILGSGSATVGDGPIRLSISVGPDGTSASLDGRSVVSMQDRVIPTAFGLAVWSQQDPATIVVDRFEVHAPAGP